MGAANREHPIDLPQNKGGQGIIAAELIGGLLLGSRLERQIIQGIKGFGQSPAARAQGAFGNAQGGQIAKIGDLHIIAQKQPGRFIIKAGQRFDGSGAIAIPIAVPIAGGHKHLRGNPGLGKGDHRFPFIQPKTIEIVHRS